MEDGASNKRPIMVPLSMEEMEHERNVKIAICSVAFLGLAAAVRMVRPFKRFSNPSDIPNRFIRFRTKLNGNVERIEPKGPLLMVQHKPVIPILPKKAASLPVKISGISINSNGVSWLQTIVAGNKVHFIPMLKQSDCVQCQVTMDQETVDNKIKTINLAANLIQIGFGKIEASDQALSKKTSFNKNYIKTLKSAEIVAEKRRLGKWYYPSKAQKITLKLISYTLSLIKNSRSKAKAKKAVSSKKSEQRVEFSKLDNA